MANVPAVRCLVCAILAGCSEAELVGPVDLPVDGGGGGGSGRDGNGTDQAACRKVDLVIAVDPSSSMDTELVAMSAVFGGFAGALLAVNHDFEDFRTGVLDACPTPAAFNTRGDGGPCAFAGGQPWIDSGSPTMVDEFRCVGAIDSAPGPDFGCTSVDDDDERPLQAAIAALGGANPGFLRPDALLVIMAITDEDEEMVLDDANDELWTGPALDAHADALYDGLVAARGNVANMVFIAIAGGMPDGCAAGAYGAAEPAEVMDATADRFLAHDRGVKWDLCDGGLDQALDQAIAVIDRACTDFVE